MAESKLTQESLVEYVHSYSVQLLAQYRQMLKNPPDEGSDLVYKAIRELSHKCDEQTLNQILILARAIQIDSVGGLMALLEGLPADAGIGGSLTIIDKTLNNEILCDEAFSLYANHLLYIEYQIPE